MLKLPFLFLFTFVFTLLSFAGGTIIKGQIKDIESQKPIYGATVNIKFTDGYEFFSLTDSMGNYEINTSAEVLEKDYDIQISAKDYHTLYGFLHVKKNTHKNYELKQKTLTPITEIKPIKKDSIIIPEAEPLIGYANNNLVFLIDVSSSMNEPNRLPLLKTSLKYLVNKFRPEDRITLLTFSDGVKEVLSATSAQNKELILATIDKLNFESSSNASSALQYAYNKAKSSFISEGNNRIIMATDGIFTSGDKDYKKIQKLIDKGKQNAIALTIFVFGSSNDYVQHKLSKLTDKGNGHLFFIPDQTTAEVHMIEEAKAVRKK